jgi:hypothetical protein
VFRTAVISGREMRHKTQGLRGLVYVPMRIGAASHQRRWWTVGCQFATPSARVDGPPAAPAVIVVGHADEPTSLGDRDTNPDRVGTVKRQPCEDVVSHWHAADDSTPSNCVMTSLEAVLPPRVGFPTSSPEDLVTAIVCSPQSRRRLSRMSRVRRETASRTSLRAGATVQLELFARLMEFRHDSPPLTSLPSDARNPLS